MLRRQFLATLIGSTALGILSDRALSASKVIKPPRLKPGAGVGIVSPAGATFVAEELDIVLDAVRGLGLVPYVAPHARDRYGYLAGQDRDRAADLNQCFADPKIDLILPIRGGWGCSRLLPYLDFNLIRQNPKIIVGFSDITALLWAIYAQTGLITFHGPNGLTGWRSEQTASFKTLLFAAQTPTYRHALAAEDSDRLMPVKNRLRTLTPGKAQGRLIGGNLTIISTLLGTPYLPNLKGAILFLEDVGESLYRIDRFLTHLQLAGALSDLAGVVFGQCVDCAPNSDYGSLTLEEILRDRLVPLQIPAFSGAAIGHLETILTYPIGAMVQMDADQGTMQLLESAVK